MGQTATTRPFTLGAVLSVTTGKLLCDIGEVYQILSWMTGRDIFTHEIPSANDQCQPALIEAFPELAAIDHSGVNPETWKAMLTDWVDTHGPTRDVSPLGWNRLKEQSPIDTLTEMVGRDRIIVVEPPDA